MKQIIYLGGKKARDAHTTAELDITAVDVIGDCDWKEGEVKTEGVDYVLHDWWDVIVPIPKKQEGESAATPPDVEQLAEDYAFKKTLDSGLDKRLRTARIAAFKAGYQSGQSAVQDATPQEWEKGKGWQDLVEKAFYYELMDMGASIRLLDFIHKTVVAPLQSELSTLRSELSAAQEENKRLRGAMEVFANEIKGEQTK